jgi:hypothetical protein
MSPADHAAGARPTTAGRRDGRRDAAGVGVGIRLGPAAGGSGGARLDVDAFERQAAAGHPHHRKRLVGPRQALAPAPRGDRPDFDAEQLGSRLVADVGNELGE